MIAGITPVIFDLLRIVYVFLSKMSGLCTQVHVDVNRKMVPDCGIEPQF